MPDFYLLVSTNKIYRLLLALSHYYHQKFCGLHDFIRSNEVKGEKLSIFSCVSYCLAFLY